MVLFGDFGDALALALGGDLLYVGDLVHDALVLGGSCPWSFEEILEDDDVVLLCLMTWSFDGGLTW